MFVTLWVIWLMLNNSTDPEILWLGGGVSLLLAVIFCRSCSLFKEINFTPKALFYSVIYLFIFLIELIKANVDIAYRVLSPSLPINPGILHAKTKLQSKIGRMILANSITLTPGTFTINIKDEDLYIHFVNVTDDSEKEVKDTINKFEKYLEVIYG